MSTTPLMHLSLAALVAITAHCGRAGSPTTTGTPSPPAEGTAMKDAPTDAESPLAAARDHFRRAVAAAWGVDAALITVQPVHPGLPDNPYDVLATGDLFAVRADFPGADPGPAGFAAADGQVAFARHPEGLKALMLAAGVVGSASPRLATDALVARVQWVYPALGKVTTFDPNRGVEVAGPLLDDDPDVEGGVRLTWHVLALGATGSSAVRKVRLHVAADGTTRLESTVP